MINIIFDIFQMKNGNTPGVRRSIQKRQDLLTNQENSILDMMGNYNLKQKYKNIPRNYRPDIVKIYNDYMSSENMNKEIVLGLIENEIEKYKDENVDDLFSNMSLTKKQRKLPGMYYVNKRKRDELADKMGKLNIKKGIKKGINKSKNSDYIIDMFEKISIKN
jgi:hypothetical protein